MTRFERTELMILSGSLTDHQIQLLDAAEPVFARWRRLRAAERAEAVVSATRHPAAA